MTYETVLDNLEVDVNTYNPWRGWQRLLLGIDIVSGVAFVVMYLVLVVDGFSAQSEGRFALMRHSERLTSWSGVLGLTLTLTAMTSIALLVTRKFVSWTWPQKLLLILGGGGLFFGALSWVIYLAYSSDWISQYDPGVNYAALAKEVRSATIFNFVFGIVLALLATLLHYWFRPALQQPQEVYSS